MITRNQHGVPLETLYGKHADETIIIIGNSASLNEMEHDVFDCFTTIGLNRILRVYDPIYLMVVDESVVKDEYMRMREYTGTVLAYPGCMSSKCRSLYPGPWVSTGPMTSQCDPCAKHGPIHICRGGNSAYEALQIAMRMGAKRIAFAGVDMYWPPGRDSHFFGSGVKAGCRLAAPEYKVEDFGRLKDQYAISGISVVSISPWDTPFRKRMGYIPARDL